MNALEGSSQKRLTRNAVPDVTPVWSPSCKKVAFTGVRGDDQEIYTMKAGPEGRANRPINLTKNGVADDEPGWQPLVN